MSEARNPLAADQFGRCGFCVGRKAGEPDPPVKTESYQHGACPCCGQLGGTGMTLYDGPCTGKH